MIYHGNEQCWRIMLPHSWDEYLAGLSKRCRRLLRQQQKDWIESGRAKFQVISEPDQIQPALQDLIRLHTARRATLGCPGCFETAHFTEFMYDVSEQAMADQRLLLTRLTLDGRLAGCGLGFLGKSTLYAYQCGIEPELAESRPGWLLNQFLIRHAMEQGWEQLDFLRGNEAYKSRLGG